MTSEYSWTERQFLGFVQWLSRRSENRQILWLGALALVAGIADLAMPNNWARTVVLVMALPAIIAYTMGMLMVVVIDAKRRLVARMTDSVLKMQSLRFDQFENFVALILAAEGYEIVLCGGRNPDGGVDLEAIKEIV